MSANDPAETRFNREQCFEPEQPTEQSVIPLVKPFLIGNELEYIRQTIAMGNIAGDGAFSERCCELMRQRFGLREVLLVSSGTTALDMAAVLCEIEPGDEVIMPSFTFVSTANAFLRLGARIVFVDIRPDTLNLDESKIERAITPRTKVIVPVHYAGVGCEMQAIQAIADAHHLLVVEDAAQGVDAYYQGRPLGSLGNMAAYSFHEAKNHTAGQAGALCINDPRFVRRAEILRDKGTNRREFFRGEAARYEWIDIGVGHALSEINAAFLCAQLEKIDEIGARRQQIDTFYRQQLAPLANDHLIKFGSIPPHCQTNHHICYFLVESAAVRARLTDYMRSRRIAAPFHYVPLHTAPMGRKLGYQTGDLPVTEDVAARLIRLPFYHDLEEKDQQRVCDEVARFFQTVYHG